MNEGPQSKIILPGRVRRRMDPNESLRARRDRGQRRARASLSSRDAIVERGEGVGAGVVERVRVRGDGEPLIRFGPRARQRHHVRRDDVGRVVRALAIDFDHHRLPRQQDHVVREVEDRVDPGIRLLVLDASRGAVGEAQGEGQAVADDGSLAFFTTYCRPSSSNDGSFNRNVA